MASKQSQCKHTETWRHTHIVIPLPSPCRCWLHRARGAARCASTQRWPSSTPGRLRHLVSPCGASWWQQAAAQAAAAAAKAQVRSAQDDSHQQFVGQADNRNMQLHLSTLCQLLTVHEDPLTKAASSSQTGATRDMHVWQACRAIQGDPETTLTNFIYVPN